MRRRKWIRLATGYTALLFLAPVGCSKEESSQSDTKATGNAPAEAARSIGPESSPVEPSLDKGWCNGHGVPESVCTRCNASLIPKFKAAGDWCKEHGLPESQCTVCNPAVEAEWAKLNPANATTSAPESTGDSERASGKLGPASSPIEPTLDQGWCGGHGVPESVCTRCNPSLIPKFQAAGDWCMEHGLPESQCTVCNPAVEAEWAKLNPANATTSAPESTGDSERASGKLGPASSPIEPTLDQGWCGGHGVPESVCTRCNPSLIPKFQAAGDWCKEHGLPESQCTVCNPAVEAEWAKLNPANATTSAPESTGDSERASGKLGPASSPIEPTLDLGWCGGHGVPESVCTRCNPSLIPKFQAAGDWCKEHGLPESQCTVCNPEVEAEWAKLNPAARKHKPSGDVGLAPGQGPDDRQVRYDGKWCTEHGVPESVCTRCSPVLITRFKEANDWCAEHGLPESQCTICNPEVREKWAGLRPAPSVTIENDSQDVRLERSPRLLTGASDPLCQVDTLRVRFIDPSIVRKAGIEVQRVGRRTMSATIEVPAEVEFDATRLTRVTPRVAGVVREVPAALGDTVDAQDLLAVVDSPVLGEAKSRYIERAEDSKLAESDLQRVTTIARGIQQMLEICTPEASAKDIREALAHSPVGDAKAKLLRAHATLRLARTDAAREAGLLEKGLNSERDYQFAQSALAAAEAEFVALREEIAFDREREQLAAARAVEVAGSKLGAAERRLHILGLTGRQVDNISTETGELLSRFEVRSPSAGTLIERAVTVGESVEASDVLFVVADTSEMWLMADAYERDLLQMRIGLPVHFTVDGMPGVSFEGKVTWISSQVDERTRTVRVRADLPNADGLLRAKMFGRARILIHQNEEVVGVPIEAVQTDGCCQLVFVQESETVFQPRKVVLGTSANGFVEVLKGLEEGDTIASAGSFLMKTEILKSNIGAGCCEVDPGR